METKSSKTLVNLNTGQSTKKIPIINKIRFSNLISKNELKESENSVRESKREIPTEELKTRN